MKWAAYETYLETVVLAPELCGIQYEMLVLFGMSSGKLFSYATSLLSFTQPASQLVAMSV